MTSYVRLASSIRQHTCTPFRANAVVREFGLLDGAVNTNIFGRCVGQLDGYWLVYQPEQDRFPFLRPLGLSFSGRVRGKM